jgi:hypothetical protein
MTTKNELKEARNGFGLSANSVASLLNISLTSAFLHMREAPNAKSRVMAGMLRATMRAIDDDVRGVFANLEIEYPANSTIAENCLYICARAEMLKRFNPEIKKLIKIVGKRTKRKTK